MRFTTSLQRGGDYLTEALANRLHITPSMAAEKKAQVGVGANASDPVVAETLREATIELVRQIQAAVQGAVQTGTESGQLRAVLLAGGAANLPGIVEIFGTVFPGVPVQIGNPLINLIDPESNKQSVLSPADASHFTTAVGLALREIEYPL